MILGLRTRVYTPSELCNFTEGVMYENYATLFITPLHFPTGAGGPFHIPDFLIPCKLFKCRWLGLGMITWYGSIRMYPSPVFVHLEYKE